MMILSSAVNSVRTKSVELSMNGAPLAIPSLAVEKLGKAA
jgi:hypothetical protein